jgi:hypothetical protein
MARTNLRDAKTVLVHVSEIEVGHGRDLTLSRGLIEAGRLLHLWRLARQALVVVVTEL